MPLTIRWKFSAAVSGLKINVKSQAELLLKYFLPLWRNFLNFKLPECFNWKTIPTPTGLHFYIEPNSCISSTSFTICCFVAQNVKIMTNLSYLT